MKYLRELAIAVLILALLGAVWMDRGKDAKLSEYEQRVDALKTQLDSITALQTKADLEALKALTQYNLARQELAAQATISDNLKRRYEILRNSHPAKLSDQGIDSALNRLYKNR